MDTRAAEKSGNPLTEILPHAQRAAEAAAAQGRFWEMHRSLFENQHALSDRHLARYAEALGLDLTRFDVDMADRVHTARVRENFLSGVRSGVNAWEPRLLNGLAS